MLKTNKNTEACLKELIDSMNSLKNFIVENMNSEVTQLVQCEFEAKFSHYERMYEKYKNTENLDYLIDNSGEILTVSEDIADQYREWYQDRIYAMFSRNANSVASRKPGQSMN